MFLSSWTSLSFGYSFNEIYHVSECWFIQKIRSFFSLRVSAWHFLGICVSSYTKLCSWFSDEQRQFLICLHPSRNKRQLTYLPYFEISPRIDFFGGLFRITKYGRGVCLSADTYMANREWGPYMPISPCNDKDGGRGRQSRPLPLSCNSFS